MNFDTKEEKQIIEMFPDKIDLNIIDKLLDHVDLTKCDYQYEDSYRWSLLSECISNVFNESTNVDILDVVKLFVKRGLNLDFFGNTLIGSLHFAVTCDNNMIEVAKYIFDNKKYIGDIYPIIDGLDVYDSIGANAIIDDEKIWTNQVALHNYVVDYLSQTKSLSYERWNPLVITNYKELLKKIEEFNIKNKKIVDIRAIGKCYDWDYDDIEDMAYNILEEDGNPEYEKLSNFENIPLDLKFYRSIIVDEPIIITFEDESQLELEFSYPQEEVSISKNKISKFDIYNVNMPNIDLNVLFSNCLNETLEDVYVDLTTDKEYFAFSQQSESPYLKNIVFKLSHSVEIVFTVWQDFGMISIKQWCSDSKIEFKDVKNAIIHNIYHLDNIKKFEV